MRKLTIVAVVVVLAVVGVTFAALSLLGSGQTAFANDTVVICHFDSGKINPNGKVLRAPDWEVIEVPAHGSANDAHLGLNGHTAHANAHTVDMVVDGSPSEGTCLSGTGNWDDHLEH